MGRRLSECSQLEMIYDLAAVLIHKGPAANSGHYTAHIKDTNTGEWWEFDDEHVTNLGRHPFGSTVSTTAAKPGNNKATEPVDPPSSTEMADVLNDSHVDAAQMQSSDSNGADPEKTFSSSDAYMLMYVLRHSKIDDVKTAGHSSEHTVKNDGSLTCQKIDSPLPSHLLKDVDGLNSEYLDSCEKYKLKKEFELGQFMKRRHEVRSILSEAPVLSLEMPYFWISTEWLRQWADSLTPSSIDNSPIQCMHAKVPVSSTNNMKCLSADSWTALHTKYGGGPTLTKGDYCVDCIFGMSRNMQLANIYRDQRSLMKELAEAALTGEPSDGNSYYIAKSWLLQWLRRKNTDLPCDADSEPTASIRCPHGELMPELAPGAKRVLVPERLWDFIHQTAMMVKPDNFVGCSAFPSNCEPCASCSVELTEAAFSEDTLRVLKLKQRQNHETLAMNKNIALYPDTKYFLLPSSWLSKWRSYVNAIGKNSSSEELDTLSTVVDMLLCKQHSKLLERPPTLIWKRELIFQKSVAVDGLTLITEDDWRLLCEEWGGTVSNCISAIIELDKIVLDNKIGSCEEMLIKEENVTVSDEVTCLSSSIIVRTSPKVCEECISEKENSELVRKLNYINEDICVHLINGKEPPKSILEASGSIADSSRRMSKRSRKATNGNFVNLNVSGSTSIYQLKMMIWESFGVVKENQILHKGSKIIDGEAGSLADLNIFPGDVLWVTDSKIHESRDIADEILDSNFNLQKAEEGFRGTLLASTISSQTVSEA